MIGLVQILVARLTLGIWNLILCFICNKQYMERMLANERNFAGSENENRLTESALKKSSTKDLIE